MRKFCDNSLAGDQKHVSVRFLFRPTLVYDQLADLCCLPDYLGDSAALAMERDCLMQSFDFEIQGASILHLLLEERRSIDEGDVPRFMVDLDSRFLTSSGIKIVDRDCLDLFLLDCSPWERFLRRIKSMGVDDLALQCRVIDLILPAASINTAQHLNSSMDIEPINFVSESTEIARRIQSFSI